MKLASSAHEHLGASAGRAARAAPCGAERGGGPGRPATRVASPAWLCTGACWERNEWPGVPRPRTRRRRRLPWPTTRLAAPRVRRGALPGREAGHERVKASWLPNVDRGARRARVPPEKSAPPYRLHPPEPLHGPDMLRTCCCLAGDARLRCRVSLRTVCAPATAQRLSRDVSAAPRCSLQLHCVWQLAAPHCDRRWLRPWLVPHLSPSTLGAVAQLPRGPARFRKRCWCTCLAWRRKMRARAPRACAALGVTRRPTLS
jgi:hypothetical protein